MGLRKLSILAAAIAASSFLVPAADAAPGARPPVVWLKGEGNFTKSHRQVGSIDRIVVHVTEGAFWGSVRWLKSPRAHASSHYVVSRRGRIVQLVHMSDIAWHAGNWNVNTQSVGIEHEGFTYGPARLHERAVPRLRAARRVDRPPLADADRPAALHRPRRGPGTRWRARRLLAPHRSRAALEVGLLPQARPPLRGGSEAERAPRRAGEPAARHRPVAREGNRRHRPGRVLDRRPGRLDRHPPALCPLARAEHDHARQRHARAPGARRRRARPLRHRAEDDRRRQQVVRAHERRRATVDEGARPGEAARPPVGREGGDDDLPRRRPPPRRRPAPALPLRLERRARQARQARAPGRSRRRSTAGSRSVGSRSSPRSESFRSRSRP